MFSDQLRKARILRGLTQIQLSKLAGIAKSTISMYENGNREPDFETAELLADILNVPLGSLISADVTVPSNAHAVRIPVFASVPAGIPLEAVEDIVDFEEISSDLAKQGDFFALRVKGDSMEPRIREGDVVIIRRQESVDNGDLAVILINSNDATLKRFFKTESGVKLVSSNPKYDPFFFSPDEVNNLPVRVIGKVVELRAKF